MRWGVAMVTVSIVTGGIITGGSVVIGVVSRISGSHDIFVIRRAGVVTLVVTLVYIETVIV